VLGWAFLFSKLIERRETVSQEPVTASKSSASLQFYSLAEVGLILGVNKRLVLEWIHDGHLPVFRLGPGHRVMRVRKADLEKFIDAHIQTGAAVPASTGAVAE
jgi:excisionase family DNA binding protein